MSNRGIIAVGVALCWSLLAGLGGGMPGHIFTTLLGATMVLTTFYVLRGPLLFAAFRLGRFVERERDRSQLAQQDTVDLAQLKHRP